MGTGVLVGSGTGVFVGAGVLVGAGMAVGSGVFVGAAVGSGIAVGSGAVVGVGSDPHAVTIATTATAKARVIIHLSLDTSAIIYTVVLSLGSPTCRNFSRRGQQ